MAHTKRNWVIALIFTVGFIIVISFSFNSFLEKLGENELREIARHYKNCKTDTCNEGMLVTGLDLSQKTGVEPELIPWCLAANLINSSNFYAVDALKTKFADWMLTSCVGGELTIDDANMSIEYNHNHDVHDHSTH